MRRYGRPEDSPFTQSHFDLKVKQTPIKNSFLEFSARNPQADSVRLPALNSMRRSSSTIGPDRNTKFKLQTLDQKLQQLAADVHNSRLDAQQSITHIRLLKETLANKEIERIRQDLRKQVRGLERFVFSTQSADEERYRNIRQDCGELWNQTEQLRSQLFEIKMRTERLQSSMGFKGH